MSGSGLEMLEFCEKDGRHFPADREDSLSTILELFEFSFYFLLIFHSSRDRDCQTKQINKAKDQKKKK